MTRAHLAKATEMDAVAPSSGGVTDAAGACVHSGWPTTATT